MSTTYFKRFRMEIDLGVKSVKRGTGPIYAQHPSGRPGKLDLSPFSVFSVPEGYFLLPWNASLLDVHASTKYLSFRDEIDAHVFPCFRELEGCRRLMNDITGKTNFMPEATWLAGCRNGDDGVEYCGTIQGIRNARGIGSIQNLGIIAAHRDRGLGTCLLFKALDGFSRAGLPRATLEVTAENDAAVRLYRRHGFEIVKTVYKAVEMVCV